MWLSDYISALRTSQLSSMTVNSEVDDPGKLNSTFIDGYVICDTAFESPGVV